MNIRFFAFSLVCFVSTQLKAIVPESFEPAPLIFPEPSLDKQDKKTMNFLGTYHLSYPMGAGISYGLGIAKNVSIEFRGDFFYRFLSYSELMATLNVGLKVYVFDQGDFCGIYLQPLIGFGYGQTKEEGKKIGLVSEAGIYGGYSWTFNNGLMIDAGLGYRVRGFLPLYIEKNPVVSPVNAFMLWAWPFPDLSLSLGYAW